MQLFRITIRVKEKDKRKNATVYQYVVAATTLDEAKALAVAEWLDPERYDYKTQTLDRIAAVSGHGMNTLAYNADIRGEKDKSEHPESIPSPEAIAVALSTLEAHQQALEEKDEVPA